MNGSWKEKDVPDAPRSHPILMKHGKFSDRVIAMILVLFCAGMTFVLVRSEYFPETSLLHRVPPQYVWKRFLRFDSASGLKFTWKGEAVGTLSMRVLAGERPTLNGSTDLVFPILGERPKLQMELQCRLKANHDLDSLRLRGVFHDITFTAVADAATDRLELTATGAGFDEKRGFSMKELAASGGRDWLKQMPGLADSGTLPSETAMNDMSQAVRWNAATTWLMRQGSRMEAFVVEGRLDANSWLKLWMSPTGDLLKLDSSFGLSAINEDFFTGATPVPSRRKS